MRLDGVHLERDTPCVMRDGVVLYADIYRPSGPGPYPVLLMRQPYGKAIASTVTYPHPVWFARQGFITVIQDVRGRGRSEGEFAPFVQEVDDGYDTVEWAAGLPGSNGKVGMYGFSYQGITQWAAAAARPPHLAAIAPGMCAADLYHGMFYPLGRFAIGSFLPWAYQLARDTARRRGDGEAESYCTRMMRMPDEALHRLPILKRDPVLTEYFPDYYDWCAHPVYDEYWARRNWLGAAAARPLPALHVGGWYDNYLIGTLQSYEALQEARWPCVFHRLIVGPWAHIPWGRRAGGGHFGPEAAGQVFAEHVRWFNCWLKGIDDGLEAEPAVRYYECGSGRWVESDDARFLGAAGSGTERRRWYLGSTGAPANGAAAAGTLSPSPPDPNAHNVDLFVYDARLPMPCHSYLPEDRSVLEDRFELLNYTSEPLEFALHVAGAPKATLWCQVSGGPTDIVAVLTLAGNDGSSQFLSIGRAEIAPHDGGEETDDWIRLEFSMWPFAAQLPEGSSLRIELTGSAFPLFLRHPNRMPAERIPWAGPEDLHIATAAVSLQGAYASFIELPVVSGGNDGSTGRMTVLSSKEPQSEK